MAGVTIAALTGSDSAPAKANEAAQKNDIGAAKDDVTLAVANAMTDAYETAYVNEGVSAGSASEKVGTEVIKAVAQKYQTNDQIGKAIIEIKGYGSISNVTKNAKVVVHTTDFQVKGTIFKIGGRIVWGDIEEYDPASEELTEEVIANRINSAIGQVVNYSAGGVDSWRVLYADKDTQEMFIIPTKTLVDNNGVLSTDVITGTSTGIILNSSDKANAQDENHNMKYTGSTDVFSARTHSGDKYSNVTYGLTYNSRWAEVLEKKGTANNTSGAKQVAYLCDTSNWDNYISESAPKGTYAVGAPTLELLVASWQAIGNIVDWKNDYVDVGGYIPQRPVENGFYNLPFNVKKAEIEETEYGLYNNGCSYWLASPSPQNIDGYGVCFAHSPGLGVDGYIDFTLTSDAALGLRPVVSIPFSGVELEENGNGYEVSIK